ncbi:MAG: hypothetical protein LBE27_08625, partial [Deltaproteobacteria bacterium]|nr:hypothetical protein [Deltaproteobacteria bacterium]
METPKKPSNPDAKEDLSSTSEKAQKSPDSTKPKETGERKNYSSTVYQGSSNVIKKYEYEHFYKKSEESSADANKKLKDRTPSKPAVNNQLQNTEINSE